MHLRTFLVATALLLSALPSFAQQASTCPDAPTGDASNRCANTRFVKNNGGGGGTPALPTNKIFVGNGSNIATAVSLGGDCTIVAAGTITCTKTGGVAFGPFATGTNASNLTGLVATARGGFGADVSAATGVPIFTGGTAAFQATMGSGNIARASGSTFTASAFNGTIGATTPSTGAFTTVSAQSSVNSVLGVNNTNTSAGTGAVASFQAFNDGGAVLGTGMASSGYTTAGLLTANQGRIVSTGANGLLLLGTAGIINFATPAGEAARFDTSGNFGLGTTSPAAQLHTTGTVRFAGLAGLGSAGCVGNDAFGNLSLGSACSGTGLPSGGTIGQVPLKYDSTNGHVVWVNGEDYNIAADPTVDCTGAAPVVLSTVAAAFKSIVIPSGCTIQVNANDTLLPSTTIRVACGATIQVNNTFTLAIHGPFIDPGICRLFTFTGSGKVVGIAKVRPEWFGARGESTFTGTGSGTNLTATSVTGTITPGDTIRGTGVPGGTTIVSQTSGTTGGAGVYVTSGATTSSGAAIIAALADSGAPIQLAINSVEAAIGQSTDKYEINFACVIYDLTTGVTFTPTFVVGWNISGCGTIGQMTSFLCRASGSGTCAAMAGTATAGGISNWHIKDLAIQNETHNAGFSVGLQFGSANSDPFIGFHQNHGENLHVSGFATGVLIQNAQFISLDRISISPGDVTGTETTSMNGLVIQNTASATVDTGSININQSKLVGSGHNTSCTGNTVLVISNSSVSAIAGLHFDDNEWYGGDTQLKVTTGAGGGRVSDWYVNHSNQFEGQAANCNGVTMTNAGSGVNTYNIEINGSYFSGHGFLHPILFDAHGSSNMFGLQINNNFVSNPVDIGIEVLCIGAAAGHSITITGNQVISPTVNTGIDAIYVDSCKQEVVGNNMLSGGTIGTPSRRSTVLTNTCDYVTAVGVNGGGLTTGAAYITGGTCTHVGSAGNSP